MIRVVVVGVGIKIRVMNTAPTHRVCPPALPWISWLNLLPCRQLDLTAFRVLFTYYQEGDKLLPIKLRHIQDWKMLPDFREVVTEARASRHLAVRLPGGARCWLTPFTAPQPSTSTPRKSKVLCIWPSPRDCFILLKAPVLECAHVYMHTCFSKYTLFYIHLCESASYHIKTNMNHQLYTALLIIGNTQFEDK